MQPHKLWQWMLTLRQCISSLGFQKGNGWTQDPRRKEGTSLSHHHPTRGPEGSAPRFSSQSRNVQQDASWPSQSWRLLWSCSWLSYSFSLNVIFSKSSVGKQIDGPTSKGMVLKGLISLTTALKNQIALLKMQLEFPLRQSRSWTWEKSKAIFNNTAALSLCSCKCTTTPEIRVCSVF